MNAKSYINKPSVETVENTNDRVSNSEKYSTFLWRIFVKQWTQNKYFNQLLPYIFSYIDRMDIYTFIYMCIYIQVYKRVELWNFPFP